MLSQVVADIEQRKPQLLVTACFGTVWGALPDACREWILLLGEVAEGRASMMELCTNWEDVEAQIRSLDGPDERIGGRFQSLLTLATGGGVGWSSGCGHPERGGAAWEQAEAAYADVVRDIFGNPFRPVSLDPMWLTSTVVALARGIYEDRAFDRIPILADALQDAGCDNNDILNHCRDEKQVHVRGCWVVDLVLGKT
jgi:hypothetical protein